MNPVDKLKGDTVYIIKDLKNNKRTKDAKNKKEDLKKVCKDFEALMIRQFLKEALKNFPSIEQKDFSFEVVNSFFLEALSEKISEGRGIGVAEKLYSDLSKYV